MTHVTSVINVDIYTKIQFIYMNIHLQISTILFCLNTHVSQSMHACVYERQDWTIRVMSCVKGHHLHWFLPVSTYLHMQPFCYLHICKYTQASGPGGVRTGTHTPNDFLCLTWDAFKPFTPLLFGFKHEVSHVHVWVCKVKRKVDNWKWEFGLFTRPHFVPNLYGFLFFVEHKDVRAEWDI